MVSYVVAIVVIAFLFDFINGFHDSANSIATIVGTRVLSPLAAVVWAAIFNFTALFTGGVAVAKAVGALFAGSPDPLEVIRWKEVYETLEIAIDQCMGVANAVQSISIKNA